MRSAGQAPAELPRPRPASALPLRFPSRTDTAAMELPLSLRAHPAKGKGTLSFPSFGATSLVLQEKLYQPKIWCGFRLENPLWVQESELRPGTPCGAQVGMRTNAQAPSQRLSDLLGPARPAQGQQLLISMVLGGKERSSLSSAAQHGKR